MCRGDHDIGCEEVTMSVGCEEVTMSVGCDVTMSVRR